MALGWLKDKLSEASDSISSFYQQYANSDYADACVAVGILVANADGVVEESEIRKLRQFFLSIEGLKSIPPEDLQKRISNLSFKFETDYNIGKIEALRQIAKFKGKSGEARSLAALAVLIAQSDQGIEQSEKSAIQDICKELDLPVEDFIK